MERAKLRHVAIMMDGNRRWAKQHRLSVKEGHERGAQNIERIAQVAAAHGVETLTLYAFSTENWNRSKLEVRALMELIALFLKSQREPLVKKGVRLSAIGRVWDLPPFVQKELKATQAATESGEGLNLVLALNYGGRDEIVRAAHRMAQDFKAGLLTDDDFSEKKFATYLDTSEWTDPDLLIRPSGEERLSNFLLWQISYAELYMTDILWPDFGPQEFEKALREFQSRERRIGE